jgi:hypothetical protein
MGGYTPPSASTKKAGKESHSDLNRRALHLVKTMQATMSTLFGLVTGHAFSGEYAMRFLWNKFSSPLPEEAIACHWGMLPQTVEHILLECPTYDDADKGTSQHTAEYDP